MKVLERILDIHIRNIFNDQNISPSQHAFVILVSGLFIDIISDIVAKGLTILSDWAKDSGVYPSKTELVLFTRKIKIPSFRLPTLDGVSLQLSPKAKYLGVILVVE